MLLPKFGIWMYRLKLNFELSGTTKDCHGMKANDNVNPDADAINSFHMYLEVLDVLQSTLQNGFRD